MPAIRPMVGDMVSVPSFFAGLTADSRAQGVDFRIGGLGGELRFAHGPVPHQQDGAQQRRGKHRERRDPGHQVESRCWRRSQHSGAVLGGKGVENLVVAVAVGNAGAEKVELLRRVGAADVVALAQNFRTAAGAHQAVVEDGVARTGIGGAETETHGNREGQGLAGFEPEVEAGFARDLGHPLQSSSFDSAPLRMTNIFRELCAHQSPPWRTGSVGTARTTGTRKAAVDGVMLGTRAMTVPKMTSTTPAQIQPTSGLMMALMIGWPVAGFVPS